MKSLQGIWWYRIIRWVLGLFFISIGFLYEDAWAAFIFGGIFIITSFARRPQCLDDNCRVDKK